MCMCMCSMCMYIACACVHVHLRVHGVTRHKHKAQGIRVRRVQFSLVIAKVVGVSSQRGPAVPFGEADHTHKAANSACERTRVPLQPPHALGACSSAPKRLSDSQELECTCSWFRPFRSWVIIASVDSYTVSYTSSITDLSSAKQQQGTPEAHSHRRRSVNSADHGLCHLTTLGALLPQRTLGRLPDSNNAVGASVLRPAS